MISRFTATHKRISKKVLDMYDQLIPSLSGVAFLGMCLVALSFSRRGWKFGPITLPPLRTVRWRNLTRYCGLAVFSSALILASLKFADHNLINRFGYWGKWVGNVEYTGPYNNQGGKYPVDGYPVEVEIGWGWSRFPVKWTNLKTKSADGFVFHYSHPLLVNENEMTVETVFRLQRGRISGAKSYRAGTVVRGEDLPQETIFMTFSLMKSD